MDRSYLNGVIFLDIKKAFDCVDHDILLKKLTLYGCEDLTVKWFRSYLTNRTQMCKIGKRVSSRAVIRRGIPQGSNLGPVLFLIYINDLPNCLSLSSLFADDTNLTTAGKSVEDIQNNLNVDLQKVHRWLLANKLTINTEKTEYMLIGSRQRLNDIHNDSLIRLDNDEIKRINETKTLGIIVDDHLLWKNHINALISKI